jgi:hypothetical protein
MQLARSMIRQYERGVYIRHETVTRLVQAAAEHPPAELAGGLSADWLEEVRQQTAEPPASPDDVHYISVITGGPGFDYEAYFAMMRRTCHDGAWNWHRYFAEPGTAAGRADMSR